MPTHLIANAKAYAALIGSVATGLLGIYSTGQVGHALTVIVAICTAVATYAVPNTTKAPTKNEGGWADPGSLALGVVLGVALFWLVTHR